MLLEVILWSAAAIGWLSLMVNIGTRRPHSALQALAQNRAAAALLVNFAIATALCRACVPFNFNFWLLIDIATMLAIFTPDMKREEIAINLLFPVAWGAYAIGGEVREWGSAAVVVVQFLLVGLACEIVTAAREIWKFVKPPHRPDMMVGVACAV